MESYLVCPKCASTDVLPHKDFEHKVKGSGSFAATYTKHCCANCGYESILFYEVSEEYLKAVQLTILADAEDKK